MRTTLAKLSLAGVLGAAVLTTTGTAESQAWLGFAVENAPSAVGAGTSPSWGLGITEDLGGAGVDVWNNNHGNLSEAHVDLFGGTRSSQTSITAGDPTMSGPDTHGVAFSDIDGDGDDDLFEVSGRNNPNRLFRNDNGTLRFVDAGGLEDLFGRGRQPLFLDFDNDGDMDVIITNLDLRSDPVPQNERQLKPSELYLNNGNGTVWTKVADPSEIMNDGHIRIASMHTTGPGTPSIVTTHDVFSIAKDSIAVGTGSLQEPANPAIPRTNTSRPIREVLVADFDGDLHPEFVAVHGEANTNANFNGEPMNLVAYEVSAAGNGRTVTLPTGDPLVTNCRSAAAADFDNDGDIDIFAGCAHREQGQNRNILMLNDGVGNFSVAPVSQMPATIAETAGAIVTGDLNGDGWMDAFVANGYDFDMAMDHLFMNRGGTANHWLQIDLANSGNPDAIGAQVFVGTSEWQVRETAHRNHRSQDWGTLHFGLGTATAVARVEIMWPDGSFSSCKVDGVDRRVTIDRNSADCTSRNKAGFTNTIGAAPVVTPAGPPPPPPEFCGGRVVTVSLAKGEVPTNGNDVILGTNNADTINALGGDDTICGLGGDDIIRGGAGMDRVYGQDGNDTLFGDADRDRVFGGAGNDVMHGGEARDVLEGNRGRDTLYGEGGRDRLNGSTGDDVIIGGGGNDRINGGAGNDRAQGGNGTDLCLNSFSIQGCERS